MKKITILGDPPIGPGADDTHARKIHDRDQGITHWQAKAHPPEGLETTKQFSIRLNKMKLTGGGFLR